MGYVRTADKSDISRIAEIIVSNYRINFYPFFRNDDYYFKELNVLDTAAEFMDEDILKDTYVYDDGVIKGVMKLKDIEVEKLFTDPQFQNCGIGAKLLGYAVFEKKAEFLWALEYNKRAIRFYERNGFALTGEKMIEDDIVPLVKMKWKGNADDLSKGRIFTNIGTGHLHEMAELYRSAFAREPWNDDWSDDIQLNEYIKDLSCSFNSLNFGLFIDGKLTAISIGSIRHWWEGTNYNIDEFCVLPECQGQGIGSTFMDMICSEAKKRGLAGIFLQTDSDKPSYKFYLKNGFNELSAHVSLFKSLR